MRPHQPHEGDRSEPTTQWDVFLSYSSADRDKAEVILHDLVQSGLRVWYDRTNVLPGDRIRDSVDRGIRLSRCVLLLASPASMRSQWVMNELDAAMLREIDERRKVVIPVLLSNIDISDLPADVRGKNCVDLRGHFHRQYGAQRPSLLNALVAISAAPRPDLRVVPIPDAVNYIMAYRYHAAEDVGHDFVIGTFARSLFRPRWRRFFSLRDMPPKFLSEAKATFLKEYGWWGARQVIKFFLDHSAVRLTQWFTAEEMVLVLDGVDFFFISLACEQVARERGETILMGVKPGKEILYRRSKLPESTNGTTT